MKLAPFCVCGQDGIYGLIHKHNLFLSTVDFTTTQQDHHSYQYGICVRVQTVNLGKWQRAFVCVYKNIIKWACCYLLSSCTVLGHDFLSNLTWASEMHFRLKQKLLIWRHQIGLCRWKQAMKVPGIFWCSWVESLQPILRDNMWCCTEEIVGH